MQRVSVEDYLPGEDRHAGSYQQVHAQCKLLEKTQRVRSYHHIYLGEDYHRPNNYHDKAEVFTHNFEQGTCIPLEHENAGSKRTLNQET